MLDIGTTAPDFRATDDQGRAVSLRDLLAEGPLVLYFYPADFTPGCTKEACMFRDAHEDLVAAGIRVYGVSPQDEASHRKFREAHRLPFPLIADPEKAVVRAYDVDGPLGFGVRRVSYFIERDGRIADATQADLRIGRHEDFVRRVLSGKRA
jgi:peroxiredoxin Q/BCP